MARAGHTTSEYGAPQELALPSTLPATFAGLLASLEDAQVNGPDADGCVWISGARGRLRSAVNLSALGPDQVEEALRWRARR